MNYYEHHLGDYARDTGHLSMLEHGAYRLLLDRYYAKEEGIPADQAYRLARARSDEERQAVDVVLEEFFRLVDGVWRNDRADAEIEQAQGRIAAARENGKKGGRPSKKPSPPESQAQGKPTGFPAGFDNGTQAKAHQAPSTRHQAPEVNPAAANTEPPVAGEPPPAAASPSVDPIHVRACELTALVRSRGARLSAMSPDVRGWAEQGVTDAQLLTAFDRAEERRAAKGDPSPVNAGLLTSILRDVTRPQQARASPHQSRQAALEARNAEVAANWVPPEFREQQQQGEVIDAG